MPLPKSSLPRKQRVFRRDAPLHLRHKFFHVHLSPDLRKQYKHRSIRVAEGDTVRVLRGDHRGSEGTVSTVDLREERVVVEGVVVAKADGSEVSLPLHPSNLMAVKLNLKDKRRAERLKGAA